MDSNTTAWKVRAMQLSLGLLLIVPGLILAYAGFFGLGGIFALCFALVSLVSAMLLVSRGFASKKVNARKSSRTGFLEIAAFTTLFGFVGLIEGVWLYPESDILGFPALLFGPIYMLGCLLLLVASTLSIYRLARRRFGNQ